MQSYLKDFDKRLTSIAIPYKLAQYSEKNIREYRRSISNETFYILIHYVLLFIESRNVRRKSCTKEDIIAEMDSICAQKGINIDTSELVSDIIHHCCENDGNRMFFTSDINEHPFEIRLITGKYRSHRDNYIADYEITSQGLNYIYATKEIGEIGRVSIEQIKLEKAINAGNFLEAKFNADNLLLAIEAQRKEIEEYKNLVITKIRTIDIKAVIDNVNYTYEIIEMQRNDVQNITKLLNAIQIDKKGSSEFQRRVKAGIKDIFYIEKRVNQILSKQMELIGIVQDFSTTLMKELTNFDFLTDTHALNILDDILEPLTRDVHGTINPLDILYPLFHMNNVECFNLNTIFRKQEVIKEKAKTDVTIEQVDTSEGQVDNEVIVRENNKRYEEIFICILNALGEKEKVSLKELIPKELTLSKDIEATKVVLASLLYEKQVIFDDEAQFNVESGTEVFFPEILHKKSKVYRKGLKLLVEVDNNEEVEVVEYNEVELIKNIIRLPNLYFELKES